MGKSKCCNSKTIRETLKGGSCYIRKNYCSECKKECKLVRPKIGYYPQDSNKAKMVRRNEVIDTILK